MTKIFRKDPVTTRSADASDSRVETSISEKDAKFGRLSTKPMIAELVDVRSI